jgi:hypothetical protein
MDKVPAGVGHLVVFTFLGKLLVETEDVGPFGDRSEIHEAIEVS